MNDSRLDCAEALALLQDYLKDELTPDNQRRVAGHLAACGHCLEQEHFERNFLAAVERAARGIRCPDEVVARIRQALRSDTPD
jgi:anti-sigma factor (TIGR02949 family)